MLLPGANELTWCIYLQSWQQKLEIEHIEAETNGTLLADDTFKCKHNIGIITEHGVLMCNLKTPSQINICI